MSIKCPNKNLQEWKDLDRDYPKISYFLWSKYDGNVPQEYYGKKIYRADNSDYSTLIKTKGKFGDAVYLTENIEHAFQFGDKLREFSVNAVMEEFNSKEDYYSEISKFHNTNKIPNEEQVNEYLNNIFSKGKIVKINFIKGRAEYLLPNETFVKEELTKIKPRVSKLFESNNVKKSKLEPGITKILSELGINKRTGLSSTQRQSAIIKANRAGYNLKVERIGQADIYNIIGVEKKSTDRDQLNLFRQKAITKSEKENINKQKIDLLKSAFKNAGIEVEIILDDSLEENANIEYVSKDKAVIRINPNKNFKDTIPHEFSHLYIDLLGYNHPLVQSAIEQLKESKSDLFELIKEKYPELSNEELEKELLVTVMGFKSEDVFKDMELKSKNRLTFLINRIFRAIAEIFGKKPDFAKQLFENMVSSKFEDALNPLVLGQLSKSKISDIENKFKDIELIKEEESSFYKDGNNKLERLTEFIKEKFSKRFINKEKSNEEISAEKDFKDQKLDPNKDRITVKYSGVEVKNITFKELVELKSKIFKIGALRGTLNHLYIEKNILKINNQDTREIDSLIDEIIDKSEGLLKKSNFNWISKQISSILNRTGINIESGVSDKYKDKIKSEMIVKSDLLKIGSTIDLFVEHYDGTSSLIDWKTGELTSDLNLINDILKYSENSDILYDNKLGRAQLEMSLRAFALKENFPDFKVRSIKIANIDRIKLIRSSEVNLKAGLESISEYLKAEKPEIYKIALEKGLLNISNYLAPNLNSSEDSMDSLSPEEKIQLLKNKLFRAVNMESSRKLSYKDTVDITSDLLELTKDPGTQFNLDSFDDQDISKFKSWLGNKYSINHPIVQTFFRKFLDPSIKSRDEEIAKLKKEHLEKLEPVLKEFYKNKFPNKDFSEELKKGLAYAVALPIGLITGNPLLMMAGMSVANIATTYNKIGINYKELFSFMYVKSIDVNKSGYYLRTDYDGLTKSQIEYLDYFKKTTKSLYSEVMGREIGKTENGSSVTVAMNLKMKESLEEDDFPRVPMLNDEIGERFEGGLERISGKAKNFLLKYFTSFQEDLYSSPENDRGIPVKYSSNNDIVASQNHSLNFEHIFNSFINNMVTKKHLDETHAVAEGIVGLLKTKDDLSGDLKYKNMISFLESTIKDKILNKPNKISLSKHKIKIPMYYDFRTGKFIKGKYTYLSADRFLKSLKSFVSSSTMWLKPVAGTFNALLITMFNIKDTLKGSLAQISGVDPNEIDFTMKDLISAQKEVLNYWKDHFNKNSENNKLTLMLKEFNFIPTNFDYNNTRDGLKSKKFKLLDSDSLYAFHSIPEEWGQSILLVAQLKRMKNKATGESMWDSYSVENGELKWNGGERFKIKDINGKEISVEGLTTDEITRLKRVTSRIHGGYRNEEKTALEVGAIGQWILQFKKYLPSVLENALQSKQDDLSLGYYKKKPNEEYYEWIGRQNEGRIRVMTKFILNFVSKGNFYQDYKWQKLKGEQKSAVFDAGLSFTFWMLFMLMIGFYFDEDEEKNPWKMRMERMQQDMTQNYNPVDWLKAIKDPTAVVPKLYKTLDSTFDWLIKGVIMGKTIERGKYKGRYIGSSYIYHNMPLFSSYYEYEKYMESLKLR
jgi:hypothetical protein